MIRRLAGMSNSNRRCDDAKMSPVRQVPSGYAFHELGRCPRAEHRKAVKYASNACTSCSQVTHSPLFPIAIPCNG